MQKNTRPFRARNKMVFLGETRFVMTNGWRRPFPMLDEPVDEAVANEEVYAEEEDVFLE